MRVLQMMNEKKLMSTRVRTIGPDDSIQEAARRMLSERVGSLLVVADDRLVGIVTGTDLLRYVAGANASCAGVVVSYP